METMGQAQMNGLSGLKELRLQAGEYLRQGIEQIQVAAEFVFNGNIKRLSRYPKLSVMKQRRANGGEKEPEPETNPEEVEAPLAAKESAPEVAGTGEPSAFTLAAAE